MLIGSRTVGGWWYYIRFVTKYKAIGLVHGLFPSRHRWELRRAPDCGCCGGNEVRCYGCWTFVEIDGYIQELRGSR